MPNNNVLHLSGNNGGNNNNNNTLIIISYNHTSNDTGNEEQLRHALGHLNRF